MFLLLDSWTQTQLLTDLQLWDIYPHTNGQKTNGIFNSYQNFDSLGFCPLVPASDPCHLHGLVGLYVIICLCPIPFISCDVSYASPSSPNQHHPLHCHSLEGWTIPLYHRLSHGHTCSSLCCSLASYLPRSGEHGWQSPTSSSHSRVRWLSGRGGLFAHGIRTPPLLWALSVDSRMLFRDLTVSHFPIFCWLENALPRFIRLTLGCLYSGLSSGARMDRVGSFQLLPLECKESQVLSCCLRRLSLPAALSSLLRMHKAVSYADTPWKDLDRPMVSPPSGNFHRGLLMQQNSQFKSGMFYVSLF